jgi:polyhydroxyalkanoate synthesis regulator phasin
METFNEKQLEQIRKITYQSADDIAVSIARSFERLEERIDAMEARIYSRMSDLEDAHRYDMEKVTEDICEVLSEVQTLIKDRTHATTKAVINELK